MLTVLQQLQGKPTPELPTSMMKCEDFPANTLMDLAEIVFCGGGTYGLFVGFSHYADLLLFSLSGVFGFESQQTLDRFDICAEEQSAYLLFSGQAFRG